MTDLFDCLAMFHSNQNQEFVKNNESRSRNVLSGLSSYSKISISSKYTTKINILLLPSRNICNNLKNDNRNVLRVKR